MRKLLLSLTALFAAATILAASPKRELRSIWLTTYQRIDWPSSASVGSASKCKADLLSYIEKHDARNYNGVCLHVRTWADAVYKSSYEPWSEWLTGTRGKDPGWDPLEYAVEECHKRGMECYAWINPFRFSRNGAARTTAQDLAILAKDGWIIDNGTVTTHNEYQVFNPALPEVRQYLLQIIREIYTNYRIDGMLFDDYFYPNGIPATKEAQDYRFFIADNPGFTGNATALKTAMGDWRRENINTFMRELYAMIQEDRPDLRFGLSPAGVANKGVADVDGLIPPTVGSDWQYDDIYSDPVAWLNDGSVDFISPQIYWFSKPGNHSYTIYAPYDKLCEWWSYCANFFDRHFYSSMGPYRMAEDNKSYNDETHWADLSNQITLNRRYSLNNAPGAIMYSAKYMDGPTLSGWGDYLQANDFQNKSLVPLITWKERPALESPKLTMNGIKLQWPTGKPVPTGFEPIRRYTVYAVPAEYTREAAKNPDGDGINVEFLIDVTYNEEYTIPVDKQEGYWYAVCAYDGYGYESEPAYANENVTPPDVTRDETDYPAHENLSITNLWYRNVSLENIDFAVDGKRNRGMIINGDRVLITDRAEDSKGPSSLKAYNLETGHSMGTIQLDIPDNVAYPCNDIIRDNDGNIYITNLSLNIQSPGSPIYVYRFDPATNQVSAWTQLNADAPRGRVDHVGIEKTADGTYNIWAAVAASKKIIRWSVTADGTVQSTQIKEVNALAPGSGANFGTAPHIYPAGNDIVIIDGAGIAPTEFKFTTGDVTNYIPDAIKPAIAANGYVHFGGEECFVAYTSCDHFSDSGIKFNITTANAHGLNNQTLLWTIPEINMGSVNSTHMSMPVDAVVSELPANSNAQHVTSSGWQAHIAVYAPGNGLAVYKMTKKPSTGIEEAAAEEVSYTIANGTVYFNATVSEAAVYDLSGRCMTSASNVKRIMLPEAAGVYILRFDGKAARVIR